MSGSLNFWILALFVVILTAIAFWLLWMVLHRNAVEGGEKTPQSKAMDEMQGKHLG